MGVFDVNRMRLGYNTNGFAHHRFEDAIAILAEIGYESVAITLDHFTLNPFAPDLAEQLERTRRLLQQHRMASVIETGARFLLDSRVKHHPTLLSETVAGRARRIDFLKRAIDIAAALASNAVSFWSGAASSQLSRHEAMDRLVAGCEEVLAHAATRNIRLAFEPEPGMFIARMSDWAELIGRLNHPLLGLTIDVGHVHCLDDGRIPHVLEQWRERLFNVHIEDMRRGVHDHLMFGEGEIDFAPVLAKLSEIGYAGGVHVELSRHSHDAVNAARRAYEFLRSVRAG
jgi:sugar phosphate isomerase/epimerase